MVADFCQFRSGVLALWRPARTPERQNAKNRRQDAKISAPRRQKQLLASWRVVFGVLAPVFGVVASWRCGARQDDKNGFWRCGVLALWRPARTPERQNAKNTAPKRNFYTRQDATTKYIFFVVAP